VIDERAEHCLVIVGAVTELATVTGRQRDGLWPNKTYCELAPVSCSEWSRDLNVCR